MSDTPERAALRELMYAIRDEARTLGLDAGSWRGAADMTGGYAAGKLTQDALANEARAAVLDQWADTIEAVLLAAPPSPWQPIETLDIDDATVILRPHRIWGPMDVKRNLNPAVTPHPWVNGDLTTAWPERAFLPFWMHLPLPPVLQEPKP